MKKLLLFVLLSALAPVTAHAQAPAGTNSAPTIASPAKESTILPSGVVAAPSPATTLTVASTNAPLIAPAPETPTANPNAIKVKADAVTGRLTVKTDNPGPTRVELTDMDGRPVLTYTMMNGQTLAVLNVSHLLVGSYIVRCTAHEKTGMRRVKIGQ